jgi:hypothetical protein
VSGATRGARVRQWLRRPAVLGTLAAMATAAIGVTAVLLIADALDSDDASAARTTQGTTAAAEQADRRVTTTTSRPATTTTTAGGTLPAAGATVPTAPAEPEPADDAPDPPNPADAFQPWTVVPGIAVSVSSCTWSPAEGGTLRATGTMTYTGAEDSFWELQVSWLVNNQGQTEELDWQNDVYDLVNGQTVSWDLTTITDQPTPPQNLSCSYAVQ